MTSKLRTLIVVIGILAASAAWTETLANVEGNFDVWQSELTIFVRSDQDVRFVVLNPDVVLTQDTPPAQAGLGDLVLFRDPQIRRYNVGLKHSEPYLYIPEGPVLDIIGTGQVLAVLQKNYATGYFTGTTIETSARLRVAYPKTSMPAHFERDGKLVLERQDAITGAGLLMDWAYSGKPASWWVREPNAGTATHGGVGGSWQSDNPLQSEFSSLWVAGSMVRPRQPAVLTNGFPPAVKIMMVWQADGEYVFYHLNPIDTEVVDHVPPTAVEATSWSDIKAEFSK